MRYGFHPFFLLTIADDMYLRPVGKSRLDVVVPWPVGLLAKVELAHGHHHAAKDQQQHTLHVPAPTSFRHGSHACVLPTRCDATPRNWLHTFKVPFSLPPVNSLQLFPNSSLGSLSRGKNCHTWGHTWGKSVKVSTLCPTNLHGFCSWNDMAG